MVVEICESKIIDDLDEIQMIKILVFQLRISQQTDDQL